MRPFEKVIIDYANNGLSERNKCDNINDAIELISIFATKTEVAELLQEAAKAELEDEN